MSRPPLPPGTPGNINITELAPGRFQAETRYRTLGGETRKVRARGSSQSAARSNVLLKLRDMETHSSTHDDLTPRTTVAALADFWLAEKEVEGIEDNTLRGYRGVVENHIRPSIGSLRLHECRTSTIDRLLKKHAANGSSTKKLRVVLRQMFDLALRHDAMTVNPTLGVARIGRPKKEIAYLDEAQVDEVRALITAAMEKKRPGPRMGNLIQDLVDLLLGTGCRIGEALAVRWTDLDLDAEVPTLTISGTITTETGKGTYRKPRPKTDAGYRTLVLPEFVVDLLRRRRAEEPHNPNSAVFATRNGTWQQVANLETQWNRVVDDTDYAWVTWHVFRKSVATLIDRADGDEAARAQLGHSNTAVTNTHYINKPSAAPDLTTILERFRPATGSIDGHATT